MYKKCHVWSIAVVVLGIMWYEKRKLHVYFHCLNSVRRGIVCSSHTVQLYILNSKNIHIISFIHNILCLVLKHTKKMKIVYFHYLLSIIVAFYIIVIM